MAVEALCKIADEAKRDVRFSTLDLTDIISGYPRQIAKLLLG